MNIVTKNRTRPKRARKVGRPRQHTNDAAKQASYRARKAASTPIQIGTRIQHRHGTGIVISLLTGERAFVAFPERVWRDVPISELTVTGLAKKIPTWADPEIRNTKKRTVQMGGFSAEQKSFYFGRMPGEVFVRVYKRTKNGKPRRMKDYSKLIDATLVLMMEKAKK
jgi:hypothetical protein